MKILALDPSAMHKTGWATVHLEWENGETLPLAKRGKLTREEWDWGFWEIDGWNFQCRCNDLKEHIIATVDEFDQLVIEWPMFYGSSKGQIAAEKGYTINLAGLAMYIAGWFQVHWKDVHLYTAPSWKGTVKKAITARRFYRLFGLSEMTVDHNAIDACMMLVHHCNHVGLTK